MGYWLSRYNTRIPKRLNEAAGHQPEGSQGHHHPQVGWEAGDLGRGGVYRQEWKSREATSIYIFISHLFIQISINMHTYTYAYIHSCVYIYMYICIRMYNSIEYIYIYIERERERELPRNDTSFAL